MSAGQQTRGFRCEVAEVANRYREAGAPIDFHPYEIAEHMTTAVAGFADAWNYVEARFRGDRVPTSR